MRSLLVILLGGFIVSGFGCRAQRGKSPILGFNQVRTNVIVIITDDQGYGDLSCHGNPDLRTPQLDALHGESVRLTNFHVDPTCSPTRAALMTGRYSSRVGVWLTYGGRNHLRKDEVTMADVFKHTGYKTAMFGKWHLGDNYPFRPQDRGFDESLIHGGGVVGETPDYWGNDYYDDTYLRNGNPEQVQGYCTDVWFREAGDWIEKNKEDPFFVYIATNAPHGPLHVPAHAVQSYLDAGIPANRAQMYGMVQVIDNNIGALRKRLADLELAEDTLIVFMTDNGTSRGVTLSENDGFVTSGFNAGMRGKKGSAYDGGHRAAGFIHWPKGNLVHGQDVAELTAHLDILPTLADLCNLKLPRKITFDGESLVSLLRGDSDGWRDRTLFVHDQGRFGDPVGDGLLIKDKDYAVMTQKWRLVGDELFNMEVDAGQKVDVATENSKVVKRMKTAYEDWWEEISEGSDGFAPFVIDFTKQEVFTLSSQNWHGDGVPYNQQHVRSGMQANGFWAIDVVEAGSHEIVVRRWPREVDVPLIAKADLYRPDPARHDMNTRMFKSPTLAIPIKSTRLKVGDYDQTLAILPSDRETKFSVYLAAGEQKLQTWFTTDSGESWGAYYVYIRKL